MRGRRVPSRKRHAIVRMVVWLYEISLSPFLSLSFLLFCQRPPRRSLRHLTSDQSHVGVEPNVRLKHRITNSIHPKRSRLLFVHIFGQDIPHRRLDQQTVGLNMPN